jgi:hypothetical protein
MIRVDADRRLEFGFEELSDADWLANYSFNVLSAVRAMATIGGNLFAPSPYGDFTVNVSAPAHPGVD